MACDVVVASGSARSAVEPQWHCCGLLVECCGCYILWSVLVASDSCYVVMLWCFVAVLWSVK